MLLAIRDPSVARSGSNQRRNLMPAAWAAWEMGFNPFGKAFWL